MSRYYIQSLKQNGSNEWMENGILIGQGKDKRWNFRAKMSNKLKERLNEWLKITEKITSDHENSSIYITEIHTLQRSSCL